ncbi:hypothetical protein [Pedobacter caeni]|uniref:Zinc-ribbon 15 domain-containing protein n=1 Tax=Pedobacter caeni TaxID=288992 RepID=A0A1M5P7Y6_9SPHI|nr:hypothetical protein [Pedobacter caeni]SHG97807.1 hypothetical protein SAMN04488522_10943 [Pedobacter caeni]
MIFIYQVRTLPHKVVPCPELNCPLCGARGGIELAIFQKYAWFLMPMWPEHKYGMACCLRCDQKIPNLKWTDELEQSYYRLKKEIKTPLSLWRGLLINPLLFAAFIGLIAGIVFLLAKGNKRSQIENKALLSEYITAPKTGDLYRVALLITEPSPSYNYTYFRYMSLSADTLFVEKLKKGSDIYGDWDQLNTKEANAFEGKKIALKYAVFKKNQDFQLMGEETIHIFFKGLERADQIINKN